MTRCNSLKHVVATLLVASALAACDSGTPADDTQDSPRFAAAQRFSEPFSFVVPDGTCGMSTTVTGQGLYEFVESFQPGNNHGVSNLRAQGTATGDDGTKYRFTYVNNWRFSDLPPRPWSAHVIDVFRLVGQGTAPDILVVFRADAYAAVGQPVAWDVVVQRGELDCDPI